ncbi:MAG TPA: family 78 glycoside hydrolase catalytic domain, partial [Verrucomicrobiae bacterium]|nr:family 78 glycoside hydrolase catalytic domain [Verrucomicrobiae bacterium]
MNRKKYLTILAAILLVAAIGFLLLKNFGARHPGAATVTGLRCEYLVDPAGIDAVRPRLGWIITSARRGERQAAYQILVASSPRLLQNDVGDLWDTGKVPSDQTTQISYQGTALLSREGCWWKVRVWDQAGRSGWSPAARWSMGLLDAKDWTAQWISAAAATTNPPPCLRKDFRLTRPVRRAVLYVTALGLYEIHLNGRRVGDHVFAPDWTDYRRRVRYQAYDVTGLVQPGKNALAAILANGWYSGHIGNGGYQFFGTVPALLAQLEVTDADGHTKIIATDSSWKSHPGPLLSSDIMAGEDYDARREMAGWDRPGLDEAGWDPVQVRDEPKIILCSQAMPPVRKLSELKPKKLAEPAPGHWIYDLGQNMVGVVRLQVSAPAGTEVTLRHAEMLNPDGTLYTNNLRGARAIDHYFCKGTGSETWQPRFTYHGFRYVEVTGLKSNPGSNAVTGIVIGTDTPSTGEFACSDPRLNQLQSNIQWGQRGNYFSVPTDCPQRDERLGWMGDAQVFVRTATYNADVAAFFTKWLVDVDDEQSPQGAFGDTSPNTMNVFGAPGWGDAGVICPWTIYQAYGDKRVLAQHLPAMIRWIEYLRQHSDNFIRDRDRGNDYGDWLSLNADTPKDLIGTAYFAYSTHLVAEACAATGRVADAAKYRQLFQDIKAAFIKKYVSADGHVAGHTQTACLLALKFDLLPDQLRPNVAQDLVADIQS